jgi:hypothetical protein
MSLHHFQFTSIPNNYPEMKKSIKLSLAAVCVVNLASASFNLVDYQFGDANGTNIQGGAVNAGTESDATWNFGAGKVQSGNLNYGYTSSYKFTNVDGGTGTTASRKLEFADALTTSDMTTYSFTVDFAKWDLRQNWDPDNASASNKGIIFSLTGNQTASVAFTTSGTNGFRALSQGTNTSFVQANGSAFSAGGAGDTTLARFEALGGVLQINGDLSDGTWTAQARDNEAGAVWQVMGSGTGLTSIDSITMAARTPTVGSWGGAGAGETIDPDPTVSGTSGDYMMIDSLTLTSTAVPEPSSYALIAGMFALASIMLRRRQ